MFVAKEKNTERAPKLYDLTTLQREANRFFGYTAKQTLDYAQSLYEKKLITYPRTDSRYLTDDRADTANAVIHLSAKHSPFSHIIRVTPGQLRRCKALIKNQCCNYCDGECLLLDCECPQMISYSLICKWFKNAVLLNDIELYMQLIKPPNTDNCVDCDIFRVYHTE